MSIYSVLYRMYIKWGWEEGMSTDQVTTIRLVWSNAGVPTHPNLSEVHQWRTKNTRDQGKRGMGREIPKRGPYLKEGWE